MAKCNPLSNSHEDDPNLTIIDQSLLYGNDDEPTSNSVLKHIQHANQSKSSKNPTNTGDKSDYIYVEHDRLEAAKQIEQILNHYRQDLKQESNTQLECNQQLITRLIDFIRPVYSTYRGTMEGLDNLFEEISDLQDIRFIEQKEKNEQLNKELLHFKKLMITSTNDGNRRRNTTANVHPIHSIVNNEQWLEMEEESKKLQHLVETQRDRINELIQLISLNESQTDNHRPTTFNPNSTKPPALDTVNTETPNAGESSYATRTLSPLTRLPSFNDIKKCPICNHEFLRTNNDSEVYTHVENCLNSADNDNNVSTEPKQYECPNCHQFFPGNDEIYLQHLTECYNGRIDRF